MLILAFGSGDTSDTGSGGSSSVTPGEKTITGHGPCIGCISRDDYDKLTAYVVQGDREAFGRLLTEGLSTGRCVEFKKGETVYVMDVGVMSGAVKVRRKGETQEYWTAIESVR
jgi:hypothetical protein